MHTISDMCGHTDDLHKGIVYRLRLIALHESVVSNAIDQYRPSHFTIPTFSGTHIFFYKKRRKRTKSVKNKQQTVRAEY